MLFKNVRDVQHFYGRLGFSAPYSLCKNTVGKDSSLLFADMQASKPSVLSTPKLMPLEAVVKLLDLPESEKKELQQQRNLEIRTLPGWWLQQLHLSETPLIERMTLFWHNHFTSSTKAVRWPQLMFRQHELLRQHAIGSFANLLRKIYKDPAMLLYLNGKRNVKKKPNENFARELLELFTLGEGNYSENDVLAAARAFTGWRYDIRNDEVFFSLKHHDRGTKHFLGKKGNFTGDDIVQILLDMPRTAEFIAEKMWGYFINQEPPHGEYIRHWAGIFRDSNYQINVLLSTIIDSEPFWTMKNRGGLIKSPVDFTVGLLKQMDLQEFDAYPRLARVNRNLGQQLFAPPDVKGWRGGNNWINNTTLVSRHNFIRNLMRQHIGEKVVEHDLMKGLSLDDIKSFLLPIEAVSEIDKSLPKKRQVLAVLADPAYQLR